MSAGIRYLEGVIKVHHTSAEAFRCRARWLVKVQGWEQIGSREFRKDGEPVLVLSKKCRFGGVLRSGKTGGEGTSMGRVMPSDRPGGIIAVY